MDSSCHEDVSGTAKPDTQKETHEHCDGHPAVWTSAGSSGDSISKEKRHGFSLGEARAACLEPQRYKPQARCVPGLLSAAAAQRIIDESKDENSESMAFSGFGVARVHAVDGSQTSALPFSPIQTIAHFIRRAEAHLKGGGDSGKEHVLFLPVCRNASKKVLGVIVDSARVFAMYGIGVDQKARAIVSTLAIVDSKLTDGPVFSLPESEMSDFSPVFANADAEKLALSEILVLQQWNAKDGFNQDKLLEILRDGPFHPKLRGEMWIRLTDAYSLISSMKGQFDFMQEEASNSELDADKTLSVDMSRSLPSNPFFRYEDEIGQKALWRILHTYAYIDQELGYCQGMNVLAATLLCYMSEECAFWTLQQILRRYKMSGYFEVGVPFLVKSLEILDHLLKTVMPDCYEIFVSNGVPVLAFAAPWLSTVFAGTHLPRFTIDWLWDVFLTVGTPFIFAASLAFIKIICDRNVEFTQQFLSEAVRFDNWNIADNERLISLSIDFLHHPEVEKASKLLT